MAVYDFTMSDECRSTKPCLDKDSDPWLSWSSPPGPEVQAHGGITCVRRYMDVGNAGNTQSPEPVLNSMQWESFQNKFLSY